MILSVSFDSPIQADLALARLKRHGIRLIREDLPERPALERSLFVAYPYGRSFVEMNNKNANSIPYTSGDTLIMPTPFFARRPENATRLRLRLEDGQFLKAKGLLLNSGARELRRLPQ